MDRVVAEAGGPTGSTVPNTTGFRPDRSIVTQIRTWNLESGADHDNLPDFGR
jgi:hypothetical protein